MTKLLTIEEFCERAKITPSEARRMRRTGEGPEFVRGTFRRAFYYEDAVEAWERARRDVRQYRSTAEERAKRGLPDPKPPARAHQRSEQRDAALQDA